MNVPCELFVAPKPNFVQTVVIKFANSSPVLKCWAKNEGIHGAGAFAFVETHPMLEEVYLVLTFQEPCYFPSRAAKLKNDLSEYPMCPRVEWIKPLDRRLQRLLGWGDVCCTEANVAKAVSERDTEELRAITPWAKGLVASFFGNGKDEDNIITIHDLSRIFARLQSNAPQLQDCQHEFFTEEKYVQECGPCARGTRETARAHHKPYTRCRKCRLVLCARCAGLDEDARQDERNMEKWATKARQNPQEFWQHPLRPKPFYVFDQAKLADADKLLWIRYEEGETLDLPSFARAFLKLFGDKLNDTVKQKSKVLQLYGEYNAEDGSSWKKECDLPPEELEQFQRVWDPDAPNRCRECGKALKGPAPYRDLDHYCNETCKNAKMKTTCKECKSAANMENVDGYRYCKICYKRRPPKPIPAALKQNERDESSLDKKMRSNRESLCLVQEVLYTDRAADPQHEPAWKRRRRS